MIIIARYGCKKKGASGLQERRKLAGQKQEIEHIEQKFGSVQLYIDKSPNKLFQGDTISPNKVKLLNIGIGILNIGILNIGLE